MRRRGGSTSAGGRAHTHAKSSLASSTPCVDGGRVFFLMWDGVEVALHVRDAATGREVWSKPLGGYKSQHGFGVSPLAADGRVFVNFDQDDAAEMLAFDAATGQKLWAARRKPFRACSSMCLLHKGAVVATSTAGLTAYDPATGAVAWDWAWPFDGMALRTVGSPVLDGDTVLAVAGDGGGSRSTVLVAAGPKPKLLWQKTKDVPYVPGPVRVWAALLRRHRRRAGDLCRPPHRRHRVAGAVLLEGRVGVPGAGRRGGDRRRRRRQGRGFQGVAGRVREAGRGGGGGGGVRQPGGGRRPAVRAGGDQSGVLRQVGHASRAGR